MSNLVPFLGTVIVISLSGVMAPGPMTTAAMVTGSRKRHAGAVMAIGHGIVEFPLMLLLAAGAHVLLEGPGAQMLIGLIGGLFLLWMGAGLVRERPSRDTSTKPNGSRGPLMAGIVLTGANPYFLLWWFTIGIALVTEGVELGAIAFAAFAITHWLCDLIWLEVLSVASFNGSKLMGRFAQPIITTVCGMALLWFGLHFILDAGTTLLLSG